MGKMGPANCQPDAHFNNDKETHNIWICLSE